MLSGLRAFPCLCAPVCVDRSRHPGSKPAGPATAWLPAAWLPVWACKPLGGAIINPQPSAAKKCIGFSASLPSKLLRSSILLGPVRLGKVSYRVGCPLDVKPPEMSQMTGCPWSLAFGDQGMLNPEPFFSGSTEVGAPGPSPLGSRDVLNLDNPPFAFPGCFRTFRTRAGLFEIRREQGHSCP